ncbi:hypothetical protein T484DRAFT_1835011 [Baffinella frigidus]|nr:hypothetical protein T484DRAFT_1835011 [Cryptophyta sp. CCMP2293]
MSVVPDVLSRVQACVYLVHHPSCAIVRRGAADCLARITPLKDAAVIAALINLNFDPDKDVVASAMKAVTSIVAGRALPNGTLSTMGTILPLKNGSKRLLSPTRRLQPLPSRPVVTRQYLDEMLDSDGDGWHSYMYWSHSFHHGQAAVVDRALIVKAAVVDRALVVKAAVVDRALIVKAEVDRRGLPGWIYTRESLLDDLLEHDTQVFY